MGALCEHLLSVQALVCYGPEGDLRVTCVAFLLDADPMKLEAMYYAKGVQILQSQSGSLSDAAASLTAIIHTCMLASQTPTTHHTWQMLSSPCLISPGITSAT